MIKLIYLKFILDCYCYYLKLYKGFIDLINTIDDWIVYKLFNDNVDQTFRKYINGYCMYSTNICNYLSHSSSSSSASSSSFSLSTSTSTASSTNSTYSSQNASSKNAITKIRSFQSQLNSNIIINNNNNNNDDVKYDTNNNNNNRYNYNKKFDNDSLIKLKVLPIKMVILL